jgi:hypothetical protein
MMKTLIPISVTISLLAALILGATAHADGGMSSEGYIISWAVMGSGGGTMESENYSMKGTLAQTSMGVSCSQNFRMGSGFWFGISGHLPPCWDFTHSFLPIVLQE